MANQIVECIPNFSEGRRIEVVDAIVAAIEAVAGVVLLDRSSDADHNRSVITFVGDLASVGEAAFQGIAKAAELIDMDEHSGEHPRMGATDVVPFVPISGVSMADCVALAEQVGKRVGDELKVPVYLYEKAAKKISRRNLANVRKGEYEGIKQEIASVARRKPDFGPMALGKAGAVAIGARPPLIAFNVYLTTDKVVIAQKIAKAVRHLSGGLRFVKGAGFLVDGKAQVSMNLTDYTKTPVARVVESIRREAQRYGVSIESSELVGLIPQDAIADTAAWYLQLNDFDSDQILERRIEKLQGQGEGQEVGAFLADVASSAPAPGGGSVAAHAGALSASLVEMVGRVSLGKKKYKDIESEMKDMVREADALRHSFSEAVRRDAEAFEAVMRAMKMPKDDEKKRLAAIEEATIIASEVPLEVAEMTLASLRLSEIAVQLGNVNAITDAGTAAAMAMAALQGAALNARINLASLKKSKKSEDIEKRLILIEREAGERLDKIKAIIKNRGGIKAG